MVKDNLPGTLDSDANASQAILSSWFKSLAAAVGVGGMLKWMFVVNGGTTRQGEREAW